MLLRKLHQLPKNGTMNAAFTLGNYSGFRLPLVLETNATEHLTTTQDEISFLRPRPRCCGKMFPFGSCNGAHCIPSDERSDRNEADGVPVKR